MLRRMYNWCIAAAAKPYAEWLLGLVSFVESSFFPVPPDAMLVPMALARPDRAWRYATVCTLTSVAGGVLGWTIGALLYDTVGQWLVSLYGYGAKVEAFREAYREWAPGSSCSRDDADSLQDRYDHVGSRQLSDHPVCSVVVHFARDAFYLVAFLIHRYGVRARAILEERLDSG